jgi:LysM domain
MKLNEDFRASPDAMPRPALHFLWRWQTVCSAPTELRPMILHHPTVVRSRPLTAQFSGLLGLVLCSVALGSQAQAFPDYPITAGQRSTARQVAQAGVPLSELTPDAPDSYTIKRGDTLWDISKLFLRSPWRWPELWGMNLEQIRNPHLIYPGQILVLVKIEGRARLELGRAIEGESARQKLLPRARVAGLDRGAIGPIAMHLIQPFLNDAVVLDRNELESAPRIVAGREGRVLLGRGDVAYVRGDMPPRRDWQIFRQAKALHDPISGEVLGYEAAFVGSAEYVQPGRTQPGAEGSTEIVPATVNLVSLRQEAGVGDRLAAAPPRDDSLYVPHSPAAPLEAHVISIYGDGLQAGQNQIISVNRGKNNGMEAGHVLAIWRAGSLVRDGEDPQRQTVRLPDERNGNLFIFRVFSRVSYGLILASETPVRAGDRLTQP